MGKQGRLRIINRSNHHQVRFSVENVVRVHEDQGLPTLHDATLGPGGQQQIPPSGGGGADDDYVTIEGEPRLRIQRDGSFDLVAHVVGGDDDDHDTSRIKLFVDNDEWWVNCNTKDECHEMTRMRSEGSDGGGTSPKIVLECDVIDDERIEVRVYDFVPLDRWMGSMQDTIGDRPLCSVSMPGTHDSATYTFNKNLGASPDSSLTMSIQNALEGGILGKIGGERLNDAVLDHVYQRLCQTQDLTVKEQLHCGIRYLDLRVAYHADSDTFYTCHGVYCVDVRSIMQDVKAFCQEHGKEIVLLDFNHFYGFDGDGIHAKFCQSILDELAGVTDMIASADAFQPSSPVNEYWGANKQIVMFYHHDPNVRNQDGTPYFWNRRSIANPWPNKGDVNELHDELKEKFGQRDATKFFVLQGLLTPDAELIKDEIIQSKGSTSLETIAKRVSGNVGQWCEHDFCELDAEHNIVMVDFFEQCCLVNTIVNMNHRRS